MTRKVIVTIAPTGGMAGKDVSPHLPTQPEEIAEVVAECCSLGASIAALHARRPDDQATCDPLIYRRINDLVRERCDIVINNSTGGGMNGDMVGPAVDGRREVLFEKRLQGTMADAETCTLDPQTMVVDVGQGEILIETGPARMRLLAGAMKQRGIKPEWEVMSHGDLLAVRQLIGEGYDTGPHWVNIVLGTDRYLTGTLPYTPAILQAMVDGLPEDALFCVSAVGSAQLPATTHALLLGGHLRVGLEDNIHYSRGRLATNPELVARAVRIIEELGLEVATPEETRQMLGLPTRRREATMAGTS